MPKRPPSFINEIKFWRSQGLSYPAIQERCTKHGYTTELGTAPSLNTLNKWCKGVVKPLKPPKPKAPPRRPYTERTYSPSLIAHWANSIMKEYINVARIKKWRKEGATYKQIQDRCIAHNITTIHGATPSRPTLHRWIHEQKRTIKQALQRELGTAYQTDLDHITNRVASVKMIDPRYMGNVSSPHYAHQAKPLFLIWNELK